MNHLTTAQYLPTLVGSQDKPSAGVTLHYQSRIGVVGLTFTDLSLEKQPSHQQKYDGYILISYKWKEKGSDERDEDSVFVGVRGSHWASICADHSLLKRFLDELMSLLGKEKEVIILSYKPKTFRNLTIDRRGAEFKIKNNKRAECLFNREYHKAAGKSELKMFPFIPRGTFAVRAEQYIDVIRNYLLNHTRFIEA